MRIMGIDPGLQVCGYAILNSHAGNEEMLIEAGVLRIPAGQVPMEKRLNQIAEDIETLLKRLKPQIVAVEQLYSHYAHPKTAILMGHARGVILQKCGQQSIEVRSFAATRIKKAVTGNGRAPKSQVQRSIQTILSLQQLPEPDDVADAIAAAMCCINSLKDGIAV